MAQNDKDKLIIDAGLSVFCKKGYASTRMADVAREAGVSYGLVYHYFGSKRALFDTIVDTWWNDLYHVLEEQKESQDDIPKKLIAIIQFFLDTYSTRPNLISIFISEVSRSSVYHTTVGLSKFKKFFSLCEDIVKEGQGKGILRSDVKPHYLTYIFLGAVEAFISILVLGKEKLDISKKKLITDGVIQVFLNGAKAK
jgi:TetR/AcrR family fatty acid metabolism transcriptional regulator